MKTVGRIAALGLSAALVMAMAGGCADKGKTRDPGIGDTAGCLWGDALGAVEDSSEIPDWMGKRLNINYWNIDEVGGLASYVKGAHDSVRQEIERVTGVVIDEDRSFDNNGNPFPTKYADVVSSNNFPSVTYGSQNLDRLVNAGKIYDIGKLLNTYAPNVYKVMKKEFKANVWNKVTIDGKIYGIPLELKEASVPLLYPEADASRFETTNTTYSNSYIWVRDDILKKIYPNAKTQEEIEKQYVETGTFTKEEILDVSFKSMEELTEFLRKVKALNLRQDGKDVYPVAGYDGVDNWGVNQFMFSGFEGYAGQQSDMFYKFDKTKGELYSNIRSDVFKQGLKTVWSWFQEGLSPKECLVDNRNAYEEKFNNGRYAITTGFYWEPNNVALKRNGFSFQYRRVYLDAPANAGSVNFTSPPSAMTAMSFVKGAVEESDLPQLLRFVDFMFTKAGQRLVGWGAKSAGLFTEDADGHRKYTDPALEQQMINTTETNLILDNGLGYNKVYDSSEIMFATGWLPMAFRSNRGIYGPYYEYTDRKAKDCYLAFNPDVNYPKSDPVIGFSPEIWVYATDTNCPQFKKLWDKRTNLFEDLQKILTAKDEADFEKKYQTAMKTAEDIGLTNSDLLKEVNAFYKTLNQGTEVFG